MKRWLGTSKFMKSPIYYAWPCLLCSSGWTSPTMCYLYLKQKQIPTKPQHFSLRSCRSQTSPDNKRPRRRPPLHHLSFFKWGCHLCLSTRRPQASSRMGQQSCVWQETGRRNGCQSKSLFYLPSQCFNLCAFSPSIPANKRICFFLLLERGNISQKCHDIWLGVGGFFPPLFPVQCTWKAYWSFHASNVLMLSIDLFFF